MRTGMKLLLGSVAVSLAVSCADKSAHRFSREVREDGVELVVNSGGPKYAKPIYELEETLRLGDEEPVPKLFQAGSLCVDYEGYLYFTDEDRIKKFDPEGNFLTYISRPGQGPGEISYPMLRFVRGDTLFVGQYRTSGYAYRLDFFLLDGTYVKRLTVPRITDQLVDEARNSVTGYLGDNIVLFASHRGWHEGNSYLSEVAYGLANTDGQLIRALDVRQEPRQSGLYFEGENYSMSMSLPFGSYLITKFNEAMLTFLDPKGRILNVLSPGGDLQGIITMDMPEPVASEQEVTEFLEEFNSRRQAVTIGRQHISKEKPLTCGVVIADDGCIWLKRGEHIRDWGGRKPITYMILDRNGEYVADQVLPIALQIVKKGYVYGFCTNEDDLRIFKRIKLVKK